MNLQRTIKNILLPLCFLTGSVFTLDNEAVRNTLYNEDDKAAKEGLFAKSCGESGKSQIQADVKPEAHNTKIVKVSILGVEKQFAMYYPIATTQEQLTIMEDEFKKQVLRSVGIYDKTEFEAELRKQHNPVERSEDTLDVKRQESQKWTSAAKQLMQANGGALLRLKDGQSISTEFAEGNVSDRIFVIPLKNKQVMLTQFKSENSKSLEMFMTEGPVSHMKRIITQNLTHLLQSQLPINRNIFIKLTDKECPFALDECHMLVRPEYSATKGQNADSHQQTEEEELHG